MSYFSWNQEYELGITKLDSQNKKLIYILDKFYNELSNEEVTTRMKALLKVTIDYTKQHFKEEEKLMLETQYPYYNDQKKEHELEEMKLHDFQYNIACEGCNPSKNVITEMKFWLEKHMLNDDQKFAAYYKQYSSRQKSVGQY